ncbi:MAG: hypothetical protein HKN32_03410, partial [Flavobacteriales bacterium]|nr:hypothetical protein [Flavobacteriales bacterium]
MSIILMCAAMPVFSQMHHNPALGIAFSENHGQFPAHVEAITPFAAGYIYLESDGLTIKVYDKDQVQANHTLREKPFGDHSLQWDVYRMNLVDAQVPDVAAYNTLSWTTNFFLGDDESKWRGNIPVHGGIRYNSIYPGIDIDFTGEYNNFKYTV